jgi:capsular polysaccharide biosynthesis protein
VIEQTLDVRGALRLLFRHRVTVAIFVTLGLLGGVVYQLVSPPGYNATALVLLPQAPTNSTGAGAAGTSGQAPTANSVATDAQIAKSGAVLLPAANEADSSLSLAQLQRAVSTSTAGDVLSITATASNAREANALANAVANQLVSFVTANGSAASSGTLAGLESQSQQLSTQLSNVQSQITAAKGRLASESPSSVAGQQDSQLVGSLTTEQSNLVEQQNTVTNEINQTKLGIASANQGTEVIQRATAQGPSTSSIVFLVVAAGLCGLLLGSIFVLIVHRRDPRLWTRDQLAQAVGSPVVLSMRSIGKHSSREWIDTLERYIPSSTEQWNVRKALRELGVGDGVSWLAVLTLDGDDAAISLTAQLAMSATASGINTTYAIADHGDSAAALEVACGRFASLGTPARPDLHVMAGSPPASDPGGLTVAAAVLDAADPVLDVDRESGAAVLVAVTAGFANTEQLARLALRASDRGMQLRGVIVANPAAEDQSTGRSPESSPGAELVLQRRTLGSDGRLLLGHPS